MPMKLSEWAKKRGNTYKTAWRWVREGKMPVPAPKPLAKRLRLLQRRQRAHSRKEKGSKNRQKSALRLARLYRKIRNIRLDFLHKLTTELVRTHPVIAIEDLNVAGMLKNDRLARHIADVGWSTFRALLEAKAKRWGVRLVKVSRYEPTSKTCHACGHVMSELPLSVRTWTCPKCSTHHDRDVNAAKNLLRFALTVA
ncbi:RNA-guided endonuclease TnpB family protein [Calditerricola satsumensis]|nr:RNA-guided endonuclease TnpB family protein [Calditerricola satsumensis]